MQPAIRVEGLGKQYRLAHGQERARYRTLRESLVDLVKAPFRRRTTVEEFWALKDVSFEVQPGEVVGIIGRNGAGKSTLLKVLSRITKPTVGRVEINGRVGSLLEVGTGFHPELTGRENIYLNGSILGMSRREIDRKFDEIVAFAEVEKFLDTPVKRYSSGMYVRLAFAVAAHLEPEIMIIDEVLAVGDAAFQKKCFDKLRQTTTTGQTVLLVSHQLNSVRELCSHCLWLERGQVRGDEEPADLLPRYLAESKNSLGAGDWLDLAQLPRTGTGQARFISARYSGAEPHVPPTTGGPLTLVVQVTSCATSRDAVAGTIIRDRFGTPLIDAATLHLGQPVTLREGRTEFTWTIEQTYLNPGHYSVTLWLGNPSDYFDFVSEAFEIEIVAPRSSAGEAHANMGLVPRRFGFSARAVTSEV